MGTRTLFGALAILCAASAQGADLSLTGDWYPTIGSMDLNAGAGTDFRGSIASGASQTIVSVANTGGQPWTLAVSHVNASLPSGVTLGIRRSTDGNGGGSVSGGTDYLTLADFEQPLCSGIGDRSGIGIQLQIGGVSVVQGPGGYGATLVYRVY